MDEQQDPHRPIGRQTQLIQTLDALPDGGIRRSDVDDPRLDVSLQEADGRTDQQRRGELHDDDPDRTGEEVAEQTTGPRSGVEPALDASVGVCRVAHGQIDVETDRPLLPRQPAPSSLVARRQMPRIAPVLLDQDDGVLLALNVKLHGEFAGVARQRVSIAPHLRGQRELIDLLEIVVPQRFQEDRAGVDGAEVTVLPGHRNSDGVGARIAHAKSAAAKALVRHASSFVSRERSTGPTFSRERSA